MILEVQLRNIGPFRNQVAFKMEPTEYGGKTNNLFTEATTKPVLKVGVIYGANASGKTNFILPLYQLREELRNPKAWMTGTGLSRLYNPFMLDSETKSAPSEICVRFSIGEMELKYVVVFNEIEYLKEELYNFGQVVFHREGQNKSQHGVVFSQQEEGSETPRFKTVERDRLVLSQYLSFPEENDLLCKAAKYLAGIQIANGYNYSMRDILWEEVKHWLSIDRKRRGRQLARFLNAVDISVQGFAFPLKDDAPFSKIRFRHRMFKGAFPTDLYTEFPIEKESQGTKWLLLLGAKVIASLEDGSPLFVDELDACYHAQVTQFIIEMYKDSRLNSKGAQLIMTTHNVYLMDEHKMRSDQIWFVEKNEHGIGDLYSLSDFDGITENTPFADWYMARRFGGTPKLGSVSGLFDNIDE